MTKRHVPTATAAKTTKLSPSRGASSPLRAKADAASLGKKKAVACASNAPKRDVVACTAASPLRAARRVLSTAVHRPSAEKAGAQHSFENNVLKNGFPGKRADDKGASKRIVTPLADKPVQQVAVSRKHVGSVAAECKTERPATSTGGRRFQNRPSSASSIFA